MNRHIATLVIALGVGIAAPANVLAGDDAPTPAQLDAAKKAFLEGKKLHDAGKLPESIEKFKESYRLSKNPLLLYNIGLTMEEAQMEDLALFYYRKFLSDAPEDAAQRATVTERVKALEKKFNPNAGTGPETRTDSKPEPTTTVKPAGTYSEKDFQHQVVDTAPPGKPLDVTAFVPEDSGFVVTLNFRTAGEGKFTTKKMKWRYKELVARIPAPKMIGSAVQYYIEVRDTKGDVVTRSGKSTSPNQVLLEAGATPRFYPDVTDDDDDNTGNTGTGIPGDDDDDPLSRGKKKKEIVVQPTEPGPPGTGFMDAGSTKFTYVKWGSTITAAAFLGFGAFSFVQAGKYATALEDDSTACGAPPCREFDSVAAGYETTGKRYNTFFKIGVGVGAVSAVVAGYYWYKDMKAKKRGETTVKTGARAATKPGWVFAPSIDQGYTGAAAAVRF